MSILIDTIFNGTAGDLITTSTPNIGTATLVHIGGSGFGSGTAQIDAEGNGSFLADSGSDDEYQISGEIEGTLIDASMQIKCLSDPSNSIFLNLFKQTGIDLNFGLAWGGTSNWALNIDGGAIYAASFAADIGRVYNIRCIATPYSISLFVDGTLVIRTPNGTDALALPTPGIITILYSNAGAASTTTGWHLERVRIKTANPRPTTRGIPTALESALQNEALGLAMCFNVLLTDSTVFGFTTHDVDIVLGPTTYYAMSSVTSTNIRFEVGGNAGNFDMDGLLSSDLITETDLLAGRFDSAELTIFLVDWTDVSNGVVTLLRGNIGDITVVDGKYTASVRSLMQWYQQQQVEVSSPTCRVYHLGDARCKFDLSGNVLTGSPDPAQSTGTIATVVDPYTITFTGGVAKAGFYNAGTLQGLTGPNTNYVREVKLHSNNDMLDSVVVGAPGLPYSNIGFKPALDFTPSVSPTFTIPAGIWEQIQILVNNTWHLRHALTIGTDQLCVQIPWGQVNDTVLRASSTPQSLGIPANFNDRQILGTQANYAVNVVSYGGGGSFQIGLRHTSAAASGAPFFNISISDLNLQLIGVAAAVSSRLILHEPFPFPVSVGDTFLMTAGCDRSATQCSLRFGNIINFRGEPEIPGVDALMNQGRSPS